MADRIQETNKRVLVSKRPGNAAVGHFDKLNKRLQKQDFSLGIFFKFIRLNCIYFLISQLLD